MDRSISISSVVQLGTLGHMYMVVLPYMVTVTIYGNTSTHVLPYMVTVTIYGNSSIPYMVMLPYIVTLQNRHPLLPYMVT